MTYWTLAAGAVGLLILLFWAMYARHEDEVVILVKGPPDRHEPPACLEADWGTRIDLDRDSVDEIRQKLRGW